LSTGWQGVLNSYCNKAGALAEHAIATTVLRMTLPPLFVRVLWAIVPLAVAAIVAVTLISPASAATLPPQPVTTGVSTPAGPCHTATTGGSTQLVCVSAQR